MTKNEYKQGDRVRFTGDYTHYAESALEVGKEYTVVNADEYGCDLSVQCTAYSVGAEDLELVEPLDRRTAFLTRLQSLLREFDAAIEPEYSSYSEVGIVSIIVGSECVVESYDTITADNIMDFDKE